MVKKLFFDINLIKHILKNGFGKNLVCYMKAIHLIAWAVFCEQKSCLENEFCCLPSGTTLKLHKFIDSDMPGTNLFMKT